MEDINRRFAMSLGLTVAVATSIVTLATPAVAAVYGPDEERNFVGYSSNAWQTGLHDLGYKQVQLSDTVFQPGSSWPDEPMPNDMVCTVIEGELEIA